MASLQVLLNIGNSSMFRCHGCEVLFFDSFTVLLVLCKFNIVYNPWSCMFKNFCIHMEKGTGKCLTLVSSTHKSDCYYIKHACFKVKDSKKALFYK